MVASMLGMAGVGIVPRFARLLLAMAAVVHHVFHAHGARVHASIENGVVEVAVSGELRYYDLAWVIMEERSGGCSMAHSVGVEFDRSDVEAARRCPALQVWR